VAKCQKTARTSYNLTKQKPKIKEWMCRVAKTEWANSQRDG